MATPAGREPPLRRYASRSYNSRVVAWPRNASPGPNGSAKYAGPERRAAEIGLTPRELTVLALLAEGLTAGALARRLGISARTALKHLENIYRKCGTSDRLSTVLLAQALGLVPQSGEARPSDTGEQDVPPPAAGHRLEQQLKRETTVRSG